MLCSVSQARPPHLAAGADDATVEALIRAASAQIAALCGYPRASASAAPTMLSTEYTMILDCAGGRDLPLPLSPVTALGAIYDDPGGDFESADLVTSTDYALTYLPGKGWVARLTRTATLGAWSRGRQCIRATFTAGHVNPPDDLASLCVALVRHQYEQRTATRQESASVSGASYSFGEPAAVPDWIRHGLAVGGHILARTVSA